MYNKYSSGSLALIAALAAGTMFFSHPARAESIGVTVQPSIIEERAEPGKTLFFTLKATNINPEKRVFYILTENISGLAENGRPIFAKEGEATGLELSSWIKISKEPFTLFPGQTKNIPFSIAVPKNAGPGAHIGSIFLATTAERPQSTGVGVGYEVATIVSLRVAGDIVEEASLREFRTDRAIYSKPEVTFSVKIENAGNVVVRPRGPLEITDMFGRPAGVLTINESAAAILPRATRQFETKWLAEKFSFGRYQALISIVYGEDGQKTISAALSFWVLPVKVIVSIISGIIGLILIIFISVKLYLRKKLWELRQATAAMSKSAGGGEQEALLSKKDEPFSRAALIAIVLLIFTLIFLAVLLLFFA